MKKRQLTQMDHERLDAARNLDLVHSISTAGGMRFNANKTGLRPTVTVYNECIKRGVYSGQPITPVGKKRR